MKNHKKIFSVYERDIAVIVRGKAGAPVCRRSPGRQVEFGNELFIAESPGGMIIDHMLYGKTAPWEGDKLIESVRRQHSQKRKQDLKWAVADRGFDGAATRKALQAARVSSHICPKSPDELEVRLKEPDFCRWQTRRAGTEARIAIVKNHGGGRVWRPKGLKHRLPVCLPAADRSPGRPPHARNPASGLIIWTRAGFKAAARLESSATEEIQVLQILLVFKLALKSRFLG